MYIQTKEPGAVSLWAFCILLFCCGQIEGVRSRGVENLLPDFCKRKSSPSILESEPCKSKIVTVSVEFRTQKFLGTVLGTKSRFRDKKPPKLHQSTQRHFHGIIRQSQDFTRKRDSKLATSHNRLNPKLIKFSLRNPCSHDMIKPAWRRISCRIQITNSCPSLFRYIK